jgi:hypothetical protein
MLQLLSIHRGFFYSLNLLSKPISHWTSLCCSSFPSLLG